MSARQELMTLLRTFSDNVKRFKKLLAQDISQNQSEYKKIIEDNEALLEQIPKIFKKIYQSKEDNVSIDKIKKEFQSIKKTMTGLLEQYQEQLRQLERLENKSVSNLRKTLTNIHSQIRKSRMAKPNQKDDDSDRGQSVQIKMHQVNQETLHYQRMIEIKQKEIKQIKGRMVDALKVQEDMKNMVYTQGGKLNQVQDNINRANSNVHQAHQNLIQGREQHMSSKKKKCCIFTIVMVILLAILVPILLHFT